LQNCSSGLPNPARWAHHLFVSGGWRNWPLKYCERPESLMRKKLAN